MLELDHLAVATTELAQGRAAVEAALGVTLQPGGRHPHFGTHNMLLGLEDGVYLEVIAIDPDAPKPGYARWFDLDRFKDPARLNNWICRTRNLAQAVDHWPEIGNPVPLARGALRWQMAVPRDGILPYDNCFPAVMQWLCETHPAQLLPASGCRLEHLIISHPDAGALEQKLADMLDDKRVVFETAEPGLRAEIRTSAGLRVLA